MKRIIVFLGLLLLSSEFFVLKSQNIIRPKIACPNDIYVNSYNGVLFYQRADISIPNRSMPLEAVFYYNSSSNRINYGYGNGWSLGCEYRYNLDSMGVVIERGDGRRDLYLSNGAPGLLMKYDSPKGVFHKLSYQMVIINNVEHHLFTLTDKDGTVYHFDDPDSKRVTQIKDRNNNVLNFSYTDGKLTTISDGNGRSLILTWTGDLLTSLGTNLDSRQWHYAYDTVGNLVSVTNPMGYTVHYGYNRDNRISRFTDEEGYSTLITYNDDGMAHRIKTDLTDKSIRYEQSSHQTVIIDYMGEGANNQFTTYRWDTLGRVIEKIGNCCGYTTKLEYDENNNVIRSEDANGNVTTCTYDTNGNMLSMTDPLGNTEYYTYEPKYNNPTSYTDKLGHQYTFTYDTNGNIIREVNPLGNTIQYTNNQYGQPITHTNELNNSTTSVYDQYGNLVSVTDAIGNNVTIQYNDFGKILSVTNPIGYTHYYEYDILGRIKATTDPLGNKSIVTYDLRGNVINVTNPKLHQTQIHYDALNRPVAITDALGGTKQITYNNQGYPIQIIDALNHTVKIKYNDLNKVILVIDALGDSTRFGYDAGGNLTLTTLPNGNEITYSYDANSRLVQVSNQNGLIQKKIYDATDNIIAVLNAIDDTTRMTYDELGRLLQIIDCYGHSENYSYDLTGNISSFTDINGNSTQYTYNSVGQLTFEINELNNVKEYVYDADNNLISVTDANNNTTNYQYDADRQLIKITFANGKAQQFWYDAAGNTIKKKDEAGNITTMTYDANGNLLSRTYPDGSTDQYTYDLLGNMLTANNANANITFTYDANGQVLSETMTTTFNSQLSTLNYEYDQRNGHIQITYPSGRAIEEHYDIRGRLTTILNSRLSTFNSTRDTLAIFTYTPTDYLASHTYANGDHTTYTYDAASRLTNITTLNSQLSILNLNYTYDPSGNILSRTDALHPNRSETYAYDALHRLTEFRRGVVNSSGVIPNPLKQVQYTLDALGNRTSVTTDGVTTTYSHNNTNAYTIVGSETIQYDNNGNLTNDGNHTYQYNYRNRMISVDNGATATYQYDALDRRIRKTTPIDTTYYHYRGVQCIEELFGSAGSSPAYTTYIYGPHIDDILSMRRNNQDYYYHKNHLGSVMTITDDTGAIVETYDYDPYGTPTITITTGTEIAASNIDNTILFTGREYDYETELYYYRTRTMSPSFGRFMQHDPLLYVDALNLYLYVNNKPTNMKDPLGRTILVYDNNEQTIEILVPKNTGFDVYGEYPAHNNTTPNSFWPNGTYPIYNDDIEKPHLHPGTTKDTPNGEYGSNGIFRANPFYDPVHNRWRAGMGVHAGREDKDFSNRITEGCIRTTPDAMEAIIQAIEETGSPLEEIVVTGNPCAELKGGRKPRRWMGGKKKSKPTK